MLETLIDVFKSKCKQVLDITADIVKGPNSTEDKFTRILEGVCRRGFFKLHSVMILCSDDFTGDSILDLSRSLIEDMISIEFMKLKGPASMADKFYDYCFVEQKLDMDFLVTNEGKVDESHRVKTEADFERVKKQFMRKQDEVCRSWSCCDLDHMLTELFKNDIVAESERDLILQAYILGNRKNHLSPIDTLSYVSPEFREHAKDTSKETGLLFSLISYIKIADEFARRTDHLDISNRLKALLIGLNEVGFKSA